MINRIIISFCLFIIEFPTLFSYTIDNTLIDSVSIDSLIYTVKDLSGEQIVKIDGRDTLISKRKYNTAGNQLAEKYLYAKGRELGYKTNYQTCSATCKNIMWEMDGTLYQDSIVIIGAHFDSECFEDGNGQTKYLSPGANDNASGCAAIIEIARLIRNYKPQYNLKFIFWDEEEFGTVGSGYYANLAKKNSEKIKLYINLDMLGWDMDNDGLVRIKYVKVAQSLNFAEEAINICLLHNISLIPEIKTIKGSYIGFSGDADYFWHNGFSAIGLADMLDDMSLYHSEHDLVKYFNQQYFLNNTKLALALVMNYAYDYKPNSVNDIVIISDNISIFPNPTSDFINITINGINSRNCKLEIFDMLGNRVSVLYEGSLLSVNPTINFDCRSLSPCIYFVRFSGGGQSLTKTFGVIR